MEMREAREALDDACLKREPCEPDTRQVPKIDASEFMLPCLRILPKMDPRSLRSSPNVERVGESVPNIG